MSVLPEATEATSSSAAVTMLNSYLPASSESMRARSPMEVGPLREPTRMGASGAGSPALLPGLVWAALLPVMSIGSDGFSGVCSGRAFSEASETSADGEVSEADFAGAEGLPAAEHAASEAAAMAAARRLRKRCFICFIIGSPLCICDYAAVCCFEAEGGGNITFQIYRKTGEKTSPVCGECIAMLILPDIL